VPSFYQIFKTGLSAQSHKEHGRHNYAISSYEQKVSKQQLKFHYLCYMNDALEHKISMIWITWFFDKKMDLNECDLNQWFKLHWFKSANPARSRSESGF